MSNTSKNMNSRLDQLGPSLQASMDCGVCTKLQSMLLLIELFASGIISAPLRYDDSRSLYVESANLYLE